MPTAVKWEGSKSGGAGLYEILCCFYSFVDDGCRRPAGATAVRGRDADGRAPRQVALPVLRHRVVTNFNAEAEGVRSDVSVKKLIDFIPRQQYEELDAQAAKLMPGVRSA